MNNPEVSIVIPTFNRSDLLQNAIKSSLDQSVQCNIIVCDHGSTDNTQDIVKKFAKSITYIRREIDHGPHFCWLDGIINCPTEFVHLQYDDDWIHPKFIEKCLHLFDSKVGVVFSNAKVVNLSDNSSQIFNPFQNNIQTGKHNISILEKLCVKNNMIISPAACLYRKKDLIDALYQGKLPIFSDVFYHGVGPDYFMMLLTILRYKKFGYVNEELAFFGSHEDSITIDSFAQNSRSEFLQAYLQVKSFYKLLKLGSRIKKFLGAK